MIREFLIRQIDLIGRQRALDRRLRHPTARLLAGLCCLGVAGRHLGLILGPLARMALLRPRLDHRLGAGDLGQPLLAPRQFLGDLHPVRHLGLIGRLRLAQQIGHFGLQLRLDPACVLIRQRAVAAGVGVDLGAIQRHGAELQHPHLAGHAEHLNEQRLDLSAGSGGGNWRWCRGRDARWRR